MKGLLRPTVIGALLPVAAYVTLACGRDERSDYEAVWNSLVESERSFARAAAELGTRDAFLAYLADGAILFRPRATNGKDFLQSQPSSPGVLAWEPLLADVSAAGDLGFTTGPWSYRPDPAGDPIAHGQYFTVWKTEPDGSWKVVIDHGSYNPPPGESASPLGQLGRHRTDPPRARPEIDREAEIERLLARDRAFADANAVRGSLPALSAFVTDDVRVLRDGIQPRTGIEAARALASERPGKLTWVALGGDVSQSGDLGYTYGEYEYAAPGQDRPLELGNYLRVWYNPPRTGGNWRIAVDLMSPLPPAPQSAQH